MNRIVCIVTTIMLMVGNASAITAYVKIRDGTWLNGRSEPNRKSEITMRLEKGDDVEVIEIIGDWTHIVGGETGTSYVMTKYLSETLETITAKNVTRGRVRIRSMPNSRSRVVGWLKSGKTIRIDKVLNGYGYNKQRNGWIDMSLLEVITDGP